MSKPMKENDELFVGAVKSAYDEELPVKEKEDRENRGISYACSCSF